MSLLVDSFRAPSGRVPQDSEERRDVCGVGLSHIRKSSCSEIVDSQFSRSLDRSIMK